jgi:hypothetical protein
MADVLPPHRTFNHAIVLKDSTGSPWGPIYTQSIFNAIAPYEYLDEMLRMGKIRPSKLLAGAQICFILKAHRKDLHLCIDYWRLNKIIFLNRYPLLHVTELRDQVQDSNLFIKIDLKSTYNLIRISAGDE